MSEFLTEKEFKALDDESKWKYVKHIVGRNKELKIQADKNCAMCEKNLIDVNDLNIDYLFEDWRECKKYCNETGKCSKENQIRMCDLQFQLISFLANSIANIRDRQNALTKLVLSQSKKGNKFLDDVEKENKKREEQSGQLFS